MYRFILFLGRKEELKQATTLMLRPSRLTPTCLLLPPPPALMPGAHCENVSVSLTFASILPHACRSACCPLPGNLCKIPQSPSKFTFGKVYLCAHHFLRTHFSCPAWLLAGIFSHTFSPFLLFLSHLLVNNWRSQNFVPCAGLVISFSSSSSFPPSTFTPPSPPIILFLAGSKVYIG